MPKIREVLEIRELREEWGDSFDANKSRAGLAAKFMKWDEPMVEWLEDQIGYKRTMKLALAIGENLGGELLTAEAN